MTADLLALLVEVSSVTASGQQIRKPITLPRPYDKKRSERADNRDAAFKKGVSVLAATSKSVSNR